MGKYPQEEREDRTVEDHDESTQDWNDTVEQDRKDDPR
jgi:hypothetical protein